MKIFSKFTEISNFLDLRMEVFFVLQYYDFFTLQLVFVYPHQATTRKLHFQNPKKYILSQHTLGIIVYIPTQDMLLY